MRDSAGVREGIGSERAVASIVGYGAKTFPGEEVRTLRLLSERRTPAVRLYRGMKTGCRNSAASQLQH